MNIKTHEYRIEGPALVLLAVAGLLGALLLLVVARYFAATADAARIVARSTGSMLARSDVASKVEDKSVIEGLKKNNLFAPPGSRQHPVKEVIGILGDEALIDGRWYKQGDRVGEARIVAIGPTRVRIEWDGQEKDFEPIASSGAGGPDRGGPAQARGGGPPVPPGAVSRAGTSSPAERPGGPLSPDERSRLREQWANMSPEERQKYRQQMREQLGRRGP
jgi:hypothetical protein